MRIWPLLRYEAIQKVIDKLDAVHYLEVGTQTARTLATVNVDYKVGVDPDPLAEQRANKMCDYLGNQKTMQFYCKPSDEFFEETSEPLYDGGYDVIFIDGMHEREQWKRDIKNAMGQLNPDGVILAHDCNPPTEKSQVVPMMDNREWVGDVWKGFVDLRQEIGCEMFVVDSDYGIGVIRPSSKKERLDKIENEPTYKDLQNSKHDWLNLKSVDEFNEWVSGLDS
jgi:SAM-dependent methyltransferase